MRVPVSLALSTKHQTNFYCVLEPSHINKAKEPTACLMRVDKQREASQHHVTTLRSPTATTQTHTSLAIWKTNCVQDYCPQRDDSNYTLTTGA